MRIASQWTLTLVGLLTVTVGATALWLHAQWGAQAESADAAWAAARSAELGRQLDALGGRVRAATADAAALAAARGGFGAPDGRGGAPTTSPARDVIDWAPSRAPQLAVDELLVLGTDGVVLSSAWSPASYGQSHPLGTALSAAPPEVLVWLAAATPRREAVWMVGAASRVGPKTDGYVLAAGFALDARRCARLADLAGVARVEVLADASGSTLELPAGELELVFPDEWLVLPNPAAPVTPRLMVATEESPAVAPLQALRRRVIAGGAVLLLLATAATALLARWLARPLEQLTEEVRAAAASPGQAATYAPRARGPSEVRALAGAVDDLALALDGARARAVAAERRNAWREIARRIAHELKNALSPLALALDNVETATARGLEQPAVRQALKASLAAARDQIHSLDRLVTEFREFARAPALHLADADARTLCVSALAGARQAHPDTSFVLAEGDSPGAVRGDAEQLRRALHNLLLNAAEATPRGRVELAFGSGPGADRWWIAVRDEGPGLPPDIASRLGEPYLTTKDRGTGLGLAIVLQIAEAHGGGLEARPRSPRGLEMRLTLARAPATVGLGEEGAA